MLASQHGCVSDTAYTAPWLAGILQIQENNESNVHGTLQAVKENQKHCRKAVILVGSNETGHIFLGDQTPLDLELFTDFLTGGASLYKEYRFRRRFYWHSKLQRQHYYFSEYLYLLTDSCLQTDSMGQAYICSAEWRDDSNCSGPSWSKACSCIKIFAV